MAVDRAALTQRAESISREHHSDVTCEMAEGVLSLLAKLEREEAANDEWEKLMGKVVAERDRLKDALSHAYADARALWAVARGELEAELAAEKDRRVQFQVALEHRVRAHERTQADRHKTRAERDQLMNSANYWKGEAAAWRGDCDQLRSEIERLTPGGSEFAGDADACLAYVRERLSNVAKVAAERKQLTAERNQFRDELEAVERERAALQQHIRSVSDSLLDERDQLKAELGGQENALILTSACLRKVETERDRLRELATKAWNILDLFEPNQPITGQLFEYLTESGA